MRASKGQHTSSSTKGSAIPIKKPLIIAIAAVVVLALAATVIFAVVLPQLQAQTTQVETPIFEEQIDVPQAPTLTYWPLTGLPIAAGDEAKVYNRVLSVKIENSPEARPQTGLSAADVVYETITEGGITRFNCMFQSQLPKEVGPVRSARNSDVSIVPQYQATLFFSGANSKVLSQLAAANINRLPDTASLYHRSSDRYAPHNLYLYLTKAPQEAANRGISETIKTPPSLEFAIPDDATSAEALAAAEKLAQDAKEVKSLTVPFSDSYTAKWQWDVTRLAFLRSMNGATKDTLDKKQVGATNVVVLWAKYTAAVGAKEGTLAVNLKGSGKASVFSGGKRYDGKWSSDGKTPPRFATTSGETIYLAPGNTWFQVINTDQKVKVS